MLSPLLHSASPTNRTFYRNPLVDQLLEQARKEFDEAQRIALYREVERIVMDDAPWIAQHYYVLEYLYQPYVQGVEVNSLGQADHPAEEDLVQEKPSQRAQWGPRPMSSQVAKLSPMFLLMVVSRESMRGPTVLA